MYRSERIVRFRNVIISLAVAATVATALFVAAAAHGDQPHDDSGNATSPKTDEALTIPHLPQPLNTARLGRVDVPSVEQLLEMHKSSYILHARGGTLQKVAVEKTILPADPGNAQHVSAVKAPNGTVYVQRAEHIVTSTDGGRTWRAYKYDGELGGARFEILDDGSLLTVTSASEMNEPMTVIKSSDEGRSWQKLTQFDIPDRYKPYLGKYANGVHRLSNGTLLYPIDVRMPQTDPELAEWYAEKWEAICFASADNGKTWQPPSEVCYWWAGAEGGFAETPSGKVIAAVRYQRPLLPTDASGLVEKNGGYKGWPYKTVFLIDSTDGGRTWTAFRQLCTRFGQTRGYPAALGDGTVVVVHDTRYGPGGPGTRAMISRDEGSSWQDEVYYLDYSSAPGSYAASVVLEDDVILTVTGSTRPGQGPWDPAQMTAIRWKPVAD